MNLFLTLVVFTTKIIANSLCARKKVVIRRTEENDEGDRNESYNYQLERHIILTSSRKQEAGVQSYHLSFNNSPG